MCVCTGVCGGGGGGGGHACAQRERVIVCVGNTIVDRPMEKAPQSLQGKPFVPLSNNSCVICNLTVYLPGMPGNETIIPHQQLLQYIHVYNYPCVCVCVGGGGGGGGGMHVYNYPCVCVCVWGGAYMCIITHVSILSM